MTPEQIISIWGSYNKLADDLGIAPSTVVSWFARGSIPSKWDRKIIDAAWKHGRIVTPKVLFDVRQHLAAKDTDAAVNP